MKKVFEFIKNSNKGSYVLFLIFASFVYMAVLSIAEPAFSDLFERRYSFLKSILAVMAASSWMLIGTIRLVRDEMEEKMKEKEDKRRRETLGGMLQTIAEIDASIATLPNSETREIFKETRNNLQKIVDGIIAVGAAEQILKEDCKI